MCGEALQDPPQSMQELLQVCPFCREGSELPHLILAEPIVPHSLKAQSHRGACKLLLLQRCEVTASPEPLMNLVFRRKDNCFPSIKLVVTLL